MILIYYHGIILLTVYFKTNLAIPHLVPINSFIGTYILHAGQNNL